MINFDEEIKKFHPSLEIGDVEKVAKSENAVQDLTDIMLEVMNEGRKNAGAYVQGQPDERN